MTTETRDGVQATQMVIGGETVDAADGQTFDVVDPATGKVIATVPLGGREDVDRGVAAAQKAFDDRKGWASWAAGKRGPGAFFVQVGACEGSLADRAGSSFLGRMTKPVR